MIVALDKRKAKLSKKAIGDIIWCLPTWEMSRDRYMRARVPVLTLPDTTNLSKPRDLLGPRIVTCTMVSVLGREVHKAALRIE